MRRGIAEQQVQCAMDGRKPGGENRLEQPRQKSCFDSAKTFFALKIRFSMAAWPLMKALATSPTLKPHKRWRIKATCASSASRGWQHENIMRSRSSLMALGAKISNDRSERPFALKEPTEFRSKSARGALASQNVECAIFRRGKEPGGRIFRHAVEFPHLKGAAEGILQDVFRQREVMDPEDPRESGHHAPGFAPKQKIARFHLQSSLRSICVCGQQGDRRGSLWRSKKPYMFIFSIGRTSTDPPTSRIGQPFDSSTACAMSLASMSINPHTTSFASAKGPSCTAFCLLLTTLPAR
jgi:hypothetical protein